MTEPRRRKYPAGEELETANAERAPGAKPQDLDGSPEQARPPRGRWQPIPSALPNGIRKGS